MTSIRKTRMSLTEFNTLTGVISGGRQGLPREKGMSNLRAVNTIMIVLSVLASVVNVTIL